MAEIRFYVDADLLALARALVASRYDVTFPGDPGNPRRQRPPCPVPSPSVDDVDWIPVVASNGWLVISRDRRITRKAAELSAVTSHRLRLVVLDTRRDPTTWGELRIVAANWPRIERLIATDGPSVHLASMSRFRPLDLPDLH